MRKFRNTYLLLLFTFAASCGWSQDILLFSENFETGGGAFSLNNSGPGSNSGPNQWIINNQYTGTGGCADTPNQNNTTGGNIGGAPFSQYLHVQNTTAPSTNACFDQAQPSDQFAYLGSGFCTYGLDDIHISFFFGLGKEMQIHLDPFGIRPMAEDGFNLVETSTTHQSGNTKTSRILRLPM